MKTTPEIIAQFDTCVIPNYRRLPVVIVRGEGSRLWDNDGKEYLDLFPGWGVSGLGHCHPAVVEAVREQAGKLFHVANNFYTDKQGEFAEILSSHGDGMQCYFSNSGAESAEGAIKLARLHGFPKYKIITLENSFHGRTFGAAAATGQPAYREGFLPVVPGFSHAKLNDLASVEALVDDETCAIMVEPVLGEGGVLPCTKEFLQALRDLCDKRGMLLIFDEVQTSPARLGTWFGYQHFGVQPDVLTSAKAIANGMPMGLIMATPEAAASLKPTPQVSKHASTFGGNAIGCAAGIATYKTIEKSCLLDNIAARGQDIDQRLSVICEKMSGTFTVRRLGFMIGIELPFPGGGIVDACRERGLLINCAHGNILRLLPAFNITAAELKEGLDILGDCIIEEAAAREG